MLREGADNFRDRVVEATERGQMTRLDPVRSLMEDWLPPVVKGLKEWMAASARRKGPKPVALAYLKQADAGAVCLLTIRTILDQITVGYPGLTGMFTALGREVEHECRVRTWEAEEPALFKHQQQQFEKQHSTAVHQRRVNINRFNALLDAGLFGFGWEPWTEEVHFRVGKELVDNLVRITRWFTYERDPNHVQRGVKDAPTYVLSPRPELLQWIGKALDRAEINSPAFKPTVIPPKRWNGTRSGGYHTPYINTPRLIRFKASQETQKDRAADEYDALDMPQVYSAIHSVQETSWRVNMMVLEVAKAIISQDMGIAGINLMAAREPAPRPANFEANEVEAKAWKVSAEPARLYNSAKPETIMALPPKSAGVLENEAWRRSVAETIGDNARSLSRTRSTSRTLRIAMEYSEFPCFYFPHMLDFRGRMYPIPVGLNPQGDDLARGLLIFHEGKPITEENSGAGWLAIQVASMWGNPVDKMSFDARIAWVEDNEAKWRKIVADPIGEQDLWANSDKPFQCLAAICEWVAFLDRGFGFISHLPIVVDGTCNGIQHLSAMTRDETAAEYVNLIPGDKPKDIYKFVADSLQMVLERIELAGGEQGSFAAYWLNLCGRDLPRTLTKRPVMVLPYGGTKDAYFLYTRKWLDEKDPLPRSTCMEEHQLRNRRLSFIVLHLWDVVNDKVKGGMVVMKWLKDCAKLVSDQDQPILWVPKSGFVVRHFYGQQRGTITEVKLDGQRIQLQRLITTKKLDSKAQLLGISPNFVHSQDAAALTMSINAAFEAGNIVSFTAVHDAYGTHAGDMWELAKHLREAFVALHSEDALEQFRNACLSMLVAKMVEGGCDPLEASQKADDLICEKAPMPPRGNLVLEDVLESEYFFA